VLTGPDRFEPGLLGSLRHLNRQPSADWFDILFDASNRLTELTDIQILVRFDHLLTGIFKI